MKYAAMGDVVLIVGPLPDEELHHPHWTRIEGDFGFGWWRRAYHAEVVDDHCMVIVDRPDRNRPDREENP